MTKRLTFFLFWRIFPGFFYECAYFIFWEVLRLGILIYFFGKFRDTFWKKPMKLAFAKYEAESFNLAETSPILQKPCWRFFVYFFRL